MTIRSILILFVLAMMSSCIEEFYPDVDEFDHLLVVDGGINNLEGPYSVKLSISSGLDIISPTPVPDAKVIIIEEDGVEEVLQEIDPGQYWTKANGIQGRVGKRYKLRIEKEDDIYETEYELLKEATPIQSVETILEHQSFPDAPDVVPGIQFYVNTENSPYSEDYYLWKLQGTYKYKSSLLIYYVWEGFMSEFKDHDSLQICYRTYDVSRIITANTNNLSAPIVSKKPLLFLPANDVKLSIRYSLLTTQYSVSKNAYEFWHAVEQQNNNNSSLYTTQPYQIRGNLKNIKDPDEPILGYFMVAGIVEHRVFIDHPKENEIYIPNCALDYLGYAYIFYTSKDEWPIYITLGDTGGSAIAAPGCMDCRRLGGKIEIPDFWEE